MVSRIKTTAKAHHGDTEHTEVARSIQNRTRLMPWTRVVTLKLIRRPDDTLSSRMYVRSWEA
jgi:hypothetical protein